MKFYRTLFALPAIGGVILNAQPLNAQATWIQKASFAAGAITEARAFGIGNKGYLGAATPDLWEYDPGTDAWTQKAAFPGPVRMSAAAFSIGSKGYFGTGNNYNDLYEYDAVSNMWAQKANFGGSGREGAVGCAVNGKGYIGLGGNYLSDWWEYDPVTDAWTQKANLAGPGRYHAGAFAIDTKAYVCCGFNGTFMNDLWEYDQAANTWTAKSSLPGPPLDRPVGLAAGNKGYIVTGWTGGTALDQGWEWDQPTDTWTALPAYGGAPRYNACGFVAGSMLYIGTGYANGPVADLWAFGNGCNVQTSSMATSCAGNCDGLVSVDFPGPGAAQGYLWSTGDTTQMVANLCAGAYTVSVTDTSGCSATVTVVVNNPPPVSASFTSSQPLCHGDSTGTICAAPLGGSPPYNSILWSTGDTTSCIQQVAAGTYTVSITDSTGCAGTAAYTLNQPNPISISFLSTDASCATCPDGSASANVSGGGVPYTYSWSNGGTLVFINGLLPGTYTCCVTDANGCLACDSVVIGYSVGIAQKSNAEALHAFPVPFTSELQIKMPALARAGEFVRDIRLFDTTGRRVQVRFSIHQNILRMQVADGTSGMYLGELTCGEKQYFFKAVRR